MAAILQIRRGTSASPSLVESELFYNTSLTTLQVGKSSGQITLVKLDESNNGDLTIVGTIYGSDLTLTGDISADNASFTNNIHVGGQIYLGVSGSDGDNIFINAPFSGSIIPQVDGQDDLGSSTIKWGKIYGNNIYGSINATNGVVSGSSQVSYIGLSNIPAGIVSGSSQINAGSTTNFATDVKTQLNTNTVISGSSQVSITSTTGYTSFSSSLDSRIVSLNSYTTAQDTKNSTLATYTGSINTKFTTLGSYTSSVDSHLTELYSTASNHESRIIYLSGSFSQSVDNRLDQLEATSGSVTSSILNLNAFTSSQITKNSTLGTYTASVNSQLTELYSTASNHETRINGIQSYTSSLKTAIGVSGTDVTINGNLSVLGTTTQINSTQVNIGDNIIELNYGGSATTAGIYTKDATGGSTTSGSLLWDATNDYWKAGKLNNESKLLVAGGDGVVSGSSQITAGSTTNFATDVKTQLNANTVVSGSAQVVDGLKFTFLEINGDSVVSGSSQIDATQTTNFATGIKTQLNANTVVSGSAQIDLTQTTNYASGILTRLNVVGVISGSDQVVNGLKTTFLEINGDDVVSGSSQVTSSLDGRYELQGRNIVSGSSQLTSSYDTRYELRGNNIVSASSQLTSSYDLRYANSSSFHNLVGAWDFGTQGSIRDAAFYSVTSSADIVLVSGSINYNNNHLLTAGATKKYIDWRTDEILTAIGAADITAVVAGDGITGGGITGDVTMSLDTASLHFTNGIKTKLNTEGVISGSSQIISLLPTGTVSGSSQITIGSVGGFGVFSASVDYRLDLLEGDTGSQANRLNNLEAFTASAGTTYEQIASGTHTLISGSRQLDGTFINNLSGSFTGSFKGNIAGNATTAGTVLTQNSNTNQDYSLVFVTSGSNGYMQTYTDGLSNLLYNPSTNRLKSDYIQGSIEATNGVVSGSSQIVSILGPLNAVSHSHANKTQLDTIDQNLATTSDVNFASLHTTGTGSIGTNLTVYGNLTVWGTQSIINSQNLEVNDNIIYLSPTASGDWDLGIVGHYNDGVYKHAGIFSDASDGHTWKVFKDLTAETSGSVDTSAPSFTLADFKAGVFTGTSFNGIHNGIINSTNGVVSGSSQVDATQTANWSTGIKTQLNSNTVVSGSSQVAIASTTGFGTYINQGVLTTSNVQFNSLAVGNITPSGTAGRIDASNDIVAYSSSDRRFKDNIKPIENALDKVNQIGGYEFDWKEENKSEHGYEGHDLGVIAQEIEAIAPELVQTRENGYKAVKYDKLVSVLIEAVKELSAKVTELENR